MYGRPTFEDVVVEFNQVLGHVRQKLRVLPDATGDRRRMLIDQAERDVEEANKFLRQMDIIIKDSPQRVVLQERIRVFEAELSKVRRELLLTIPTTPSNQPMDTSQMDQRERIMAGNTTLGNTSATLGRIQQVSADTEVTGIGALEDLHHQRQQLEHADDMMSQMDQKVTQGKRHLRTMWWRMLTDTFIQFIIIVLLIVAILGVIFFKWILPLM
ncbi:vesicle transport v-SNARE protein [Pelomyxa schiedti]|nr:vesicle transport v-SNARE protein [Pelomyxa schiedti]